ncbi:GntR family transcriptional regulator [Aquabacter sp. CN5-332]|uniref:GntR family transcriptional regulator n=1 Tax=Aquabacter sp. CN5-332 TaxID=3156608 RepID=UPI0032B313B7
MAARRAELAEAPTTRRDDAYEHILSAIIFGDLAPGATVDEKHLAQSFDIGLAGVRDALYRLALEGLVERHARIGTHVPDLGLREMQDVFEARVLLEGGCAAIAAQRATAPEISKLRAAFNGYETVIKEREFRKLVRMDQVFHRTIAAATKNRALERQITILHNNASRFWYFGIPRLRPETLLADIRAHLDVVDAISERDSLGAEKAMRAVLGHFPGDVEFFFGNVPLREVPGEPDAPPKRKRQKT